MKKSIASIMAAVSMLTACTAFADGIVTVKINGEVLSSPIPARIVNDRTMLPMRSVFETLGARVTWAAEERMIFATKGNKFITLQIDNNKMSVQAIESDVNSITELDCPPFIDSDYTLVPVRAVAEALDCKVDWDAQSQTVEITKAE